MLADIINVQGVNFNNILVSCILGCHYWCVIKVSANWQYDGCCVENQHGVFLQCLFKFSLWHDRLEVRLHLDWIDWIYFGRWTKNQVFFRAMQLNIYSINNIVVVTGKSVMKDFFCIVQQSPLVRLSVLYFYYLLEKKHQFAFEMIFSKYNL